ncbi:phenylalanine and histidine ammonia-lyase [Hypoxylon fuscum]|nr:phenylalanine and histidine ammonia-lyase [Hypoxylon fuscum]
MNHTDIVLREWRLLDSLINRKHSSQILITGRTLTIPDVVSVARHNARIHINPRTKGSMEKSFEILLEKLQDGEVIYGVNTGFGGSADVRTNKVDELQRALIRELHYGILPPGKRDHRTEPLEEALDKSRYDFLLDGNTESSYLPRSWVRAAILIRINSSISSHSALRPVVVERMQDLLSHDIVPMIPLRGSISASGDLSPLSYICGAVQGKSTVRILSRNNEDAYADTAFANANLEPVVLKAKEGLAMTNGTAVSVAVAALALHETHSLAILAQILTAMSVEALNGTTESFHPFFAEVRPHPGQAKSARNILAFLAGSKLTKINDGSNATLRQDRYSIRTAPQWLGPILEDLVLAHQQILVECNSTTDNPLVTPEGEFLHGGNFQAKAMTSAMEKARQGIQGIGRMLFSQCTELINPATNRGLPPNLIAEDPSVSLVFKGIDINVAALTAELGFLANPVNHVQTAEMGNRSLNSLALISARYTHIANEVLSQLMASHLIAACQALDIRAMHVQFFESYQWQFFELVEEHYAPNKLSKLPPSPPEISSNPSNGLVDHSLDPSKSADVKELSELLWSKLLVSFDTTAGMDSQERFVAIAKSLWPVLLDHPNFNTTVEYARQLKSFAEALSVSMKNEWCSHRNAYLVHGDATPVLGKASKAIYIFLRRTLKVPLLATWNLMTPKPDELEKGEGIHGWQAPTVGSYTGVVYRALRDGTLAKVAVDILKESM